MEYRNSRSARPSQGQIRNSRTYQGQQTARPRPEYRQTQGNAPRRRKRKKRTNYRAIATLASVIIIIAAVIIIVVSLINRSNTNITDPKTVEVETNGNVQTLSWSHQKDKWFHRIFRSEDGAEFTLVKETEKGEDSAEISDGEYGKLYHYKVQAVNEYKDKEYSSEGVTLKAPTDTAPVTDILCNAYTMGALDIEWKCPNASGFELKYSKDSSFADEKVVNLTLNDVSEQDGGYYYSLEDLEDDTQYYITIRGFVQFNDADYPDPRYSDWCDTFSETTSYEDTGEVRHKHRKDEKYIALTFDDGPEALGFTERILDTLKKYDVKATFFQLGENALNNPDIMKRMASEGHEIACHTYDHTHMGDEVTMDDIVSADDAIEKASGVRPISFRSPGGGTTDAIREYCKSEGMPLYYWSIDTRDWETRDCDSIVAMVKEQAADGDIVLMHNIYESTADAVEQIVPWLIDEGYTLVTTSELVKKCSGKAPVPGVQYITSTYSN